MSQPGKTNGQPMAVEPQLMLYESGTIHGPDTLNEHVGLHLVARGFVGEFFLCIRKLIMLTRKTEGESE